MEIFATYFDGVTAKGKNLSNVILDQDQDQLQFKLGRKQFNWDMNNVKEVADQGAEQGLVLEHLSTADARLIIKDIALCDAIRRLYPSIKRRKVEGRALARVGLWGGIAIASVVLILTVIIPGLSNQLAERIPIEREESLGQTALNQIEWVLGDREDDGGLSCADPKGLEALDAMTARLVENLETEYTLKIKVFDHPMVNAFAVPGGHVVLFKGLLESADTPEEVAGVLGHEIGHVVNRDSTRLMLRAAGSAGILGMLFGDFAGGALALIVAEQMLAANYAQEAETNADRFAHRLLAQAMLPSSPFAAFFEKLAEEFGEDTGFMSHIASHPGLSQRADAAVKADTIGARDFRRVLSEKQWKELLNICS